MQSHGYICVTRVQHGPSHKKSCRKTSQFKLIGEILQSNLTSPSIGTQSRPRAEVDHPARSEVVAPSPTASAHCRRAGPGPGLDNCLCVLHLEKSTADRTANRS